jgi:hypothetical protein
MTTSEQPTPNEWRGVKPLTEDGVIERMMRLEAENARLEAVYQAALAFYDCRLDENRAAKMEQLGIALRAAAKAREGGTDG